eukprot:PRCOL_00001655-RA
MSAAATAVASPAPSKPSLGAAHAAVANPIEDNWSTSESGDSAPQAESSASDEEKPPALHPGLKRSEAGNTYWLFQPIYSQSDLTSVQITHKAPATIAQRAALLGVSTVRLAFDTATGYGPNMTESKWLQRMIFLETIAGVPGMVAGMLRHLRSLRLMQRDNGWIHTLLEEAENERMHLLTFMSLREPGILFRGMVVLAQGIFANFFFLMYCVSPKLCHAAVGYLEEEAVKTYSRAIEDLDSGKLPEWENKPAPAIAIKYWQLSEDAVMRDVLMAVRADEACHRHVNHTLSDLPADGKNPFIGNHGQHGNNGGQIDQQGPA